jgi:hypothetical protein
MSVRTIGKRSSQAAIFIYKNDGTGEIHWPDVKSIHARQGGIRAEWHVSKEQFLVSLRAWNRKVDAANSFLCIYAHAGSPGISCDPEDWKALVSWSELAAALPNPVHYLWLLGCKTRECIRAWAPLHAPVGHLLLATSASKYWGPFIECFEHEITLNNIGYDDEMPGILRKKYPKLAKHTAYFRAALVKVRS